MTKTMQWSPVSVIERIIAALMLVVISSSAACTEPVGSPWEEFVQKIRDMDPGSGKLARAEEARWRALEALREKDPSTKVGEVRCHDGRGHGMIEPIRVREIIDCLSVTNNLTFAVCVEARVDDITHAYVSADPQRSPNAHCEYVRNPDFVADDKWDPDQIDEEDLARSAVQSATPPAWMIAAGIVVVGAGGAILLASGWGAVLCPLGVHYACEQVGQGDR